METDKRHIRKRILQERDSLSGEARKIGDTLLTERILGHQWFYRSEYFLCYVSYGSEISTRDILREALKAGKKVYVPKVLGDREPEMAFYRIEALEELKAGYRGIPEPAGDTELYAYSAHSAERALMLMPGVAFDPFRNRLGYGKGFYDRYLADKPGLCLHTIAVGYRCQLLAKLPADHRDVRPYQIICV
ncbi:MAG: 5-formyltetrahydrofolate cyclo-ligase [Lachnospiraceae bacterium]|nr:5-formyltetrahydrofolate cyclo-ligase [Lachnospiraceae bacterium]